MKGTIMLIRKRPNALQLIGLLCLFFVLSVFSALYFDDGGILHGIKYYLFQVFGMIIPGMALLFLLGVEKLTQIEAVIYSYVLGYGCSLVMYFLMVPFGLKSVMHWGYLVLALISIGYLIYKCKIQKRCIEIENDKSGFVICCVVGVFLLVIELIMSCGLHTLPLHQATSTYQDFLFGVGNTIECSKEYPIINFRAIFQDGYCYHYMNNIHIATMKIVLDIPAFQLTAFYSYMQTVILLTGGAYLFYRSVLGNRKKGIICGMVLVLFTTGYESVHGMTYLAHVYMTPNNFDVALAFCMILVATIYTQKKLDRFNLLYLVVSMISFVFCFGSKAPLGMVAASVCGMLGILYVIKEKRIKLILPYAIVIGILGLLIYTKVLSGNAEVSVKLSSNAEENSIYYWGIMPEVQEWLSGICSSLPEWLSHLFLGTYFGVVSYYPIFIIFVIGIIAFFLYYRRIDIIDIALFLAVPIGIGITMLYSHPDGGSQYYFLLGTLPYAAAFGLRGMYVVMDNHKEKLCKQLLIYLSCFCVCIGILNTNYATIPMFAANEFSRGVSYLLKRPVQTETHHSWLANLVYPEEYEGYTWLRENTGELDVLMSDMCIAGYTRYTYSEGVFSERYVYIPLEEDRDEIRECYQGEEKAIREVMDKQDVKYMIQTLRITPDLNIPASLGKLVFENDAMKIYELLSDGGI